MPYLTTLSSLSYLQVHEPEGNVTHFVSLNPVRIKGGVIAW